MEALLRALLDCGSLDLAILDDCNYDLGEIIEELKFEGVDITLNAITDWIFWKGQQELVEIVNSFIEDLNQDIKDLEETKSELNERIDRIEKKILSLNPTEFADDIAQLNRDKKGLEDSIEYTERKIKEVNVKLVDVKCLDPNEDMTWFCNCLDTHCWLCREREDIYRKYFGEELSTIEENMGFYF